MNNESKQFLKKTWIVYIYIEKKDFKAENYNGFVSRWVIKANKWQKIIMVIIKNIFTLVFLSKLIARDWRKGVL